ncbi:GNAT family N-acetyltransferase [Temperatibacter marinus]|uniref:GNAT family N-acetyltransferase n=1 Tax=Temperatibacter marinus TaxID=1456591 RepID=A0AA52EJ41_9PROT|nr:GNAT family N-acetyltransferase [Temperatibacter marinus]WND04098.1 GNAT family N-acetyltransferase [Temperatibacter marinus]
MKDCIEFVDFTPLHSRACLALFDASCPEHFLPHERPEYEDYLKNNPEGYQVCTLRDDIIGAFGLAAEKEKSLASITWIMLSPKHQGVGIGKEMMGQIFEKAHAQKFKTIQIATSHKTCSFFAKFQAQAIRNIPNGWGDGMHRVDMIIKL